MQRTIALASAERQKKFWTMHDLIYKEKNLNYRDTSKFIHFAQEAGLNINQFIYDLNDSFLYFSIQDDLDLIMNKGFGVTPSVLVNGRLLNNFNDLQEIKNVLDEELKLLN